MLKILFGTFSGTHMWATIRFTNSDVMLDASLPTVTYNEKAVGCRMCCQHAWKRVYCVRRSTGGSSSDITGPFAVVQES
jgi:hypothetical protein